MVAASGKRIKTNMIDVYEGNLIMTKNENENTDCSVFIIIILLLTQYTLGQPIYQRSPAITETFNRSLM